MEQTAVLEPPRARLATLTLAALGIVYGDIGTSPLYALRECFHGTHAIAPTPDAVLGVLSLIVWSLVFVVSVKYLAVIMRADNHGEGGILALMALVCPPQETGRLSRWLVLLGLFGAALLYGDGMITPAISVLSAVEGLEIATPVFSQWVIPLTVLILAGLFVVQQRGTAGVGAVFGPVMIAWFAILAAMGVASIARAPESLAALDPRVGIAFLTTHGFTGFRVMGSVFLVVTGGEALYADMGHFGPSPIRRAWFSMVLPALLLNYFGQGALLLNEPSLAVNPFYHMVPGWALYPLVVLATAATVIASQAVITGAFSLTWQAVQLGFLPRFDVVHTSDEEIGQVYIPEVNTLLFLATVALVLGFRTSGNLAAAYGIAVTATMVITSVLAFVAMRKLWGWSLFAAGGVTACFLSVDLAFFAANVLKIADGGWFPLAVGGGVLILMTTWRTGRRILYDRLMERTMTLDALQAELESRAVRRVRGTGIYMTGSADAVPHALVRLVRHLKSIHERVVLLTIVAERTPTVAPRNRFTVETLPIPGFVRVTVRYGFTDSPNIPRVVRRLGEQGLEIDEENVTYIMGRETLLATERPGMAIWRERLFAFLARNAGRAAEYYRIPAERVLEVGAEIEL